jgi:Calmodulin-binding
VLGPTTLDKKKGTPHRTAMSGVITQQTFPRKPRREGGDHVEVRFEGVIQPQQKGPAPDAAFSESIYDLLRGRDYEEIIDEQGNQHMGRARRAGAQAHRSKKAEVSQVLGPAGDGFANAARIQKVGAIGRTASQVRPDVHNWTKKGTGAVMPKKCELLPCVFCHHLADRRVPLRSPFLGGIPAANLPKPPSFLLLPFLFSSLPFLANKKFVRQDAPRKDALPKAAVSKVAPREVSAGRRANAVQQNKLAATQMRPPKSKAEENFIKKKDFGKKPAYLSQVQADIAAEKEEKRLAQEELDNAGKERLRALTREEREELIAGLKANWEVINNEYRQLPVMLRTVAQRERKEAYEAQLEQIEKDLERLSRRHVLVPVDD